MKFTTKKLTLTALFAAIAVLLMFLETPLPFMPPFLKLDISTVPAMLLTFMLGPWYAVGVSLIKDLIHLTMTQTGGVGELADFIMSSAFVLTAGYIYHYHRTKKGALAACLAATGVIGVVGVLANKFLLIPFFMKTMPIKAILDACGKINPLIGDIDTYLLFGALPFNLIKGLILSLLTALLYKRLEKALGLGKEKVLQK